MNYNDFGNNALRMTNKALKGVMHDIKSLSNGIETAKDSIQTDFPESSDDVEMLIAEHVSTLGDFEVMLSDIFTDVVEIKEFLESIYCDI